MQAIAGAVWVPACSFLFYYCYLPWTMCLGNRLKDDSITVTHVQSLSLMCCTCAIPMVHCMRPLFLLNCLDHYLQHYFLVTDLFLKMHLGLCMDCQRTSPPFHQCPMTAIIGLLSIAGWCPPHHFWNLSCSQGNFQVLSLWLSFLGDNSLSVNNFDFGLHFAECLSIHFIVWMWTVLPHVCLEHQNLRWSYFSL
jgi:hypothetical protein